MVASKRDEEAEIKGNHRRVLARKPNAMWWWCSIVVRDVLQVFLFLTLKRERPHARARERASTVISGRFHFTLNLFYSPMARSLYVLLYRVRSVLKLHALNLPLARVNEQTNERTDGRTEYASKRARGSHCDSNFFRSARQPETRR